jgi:acetyltransferase-like isoleucine patch superfamily enzyme
VSEQQQTMARRLYGRLMGVDERKLVTGDEGGTQGPKLRDVVYYSMRQGLYPWLRGWSKHVQLKRCGGRFFVGRHTKILFPGRLSVGHNVALGDHVRINCYGREGVVLGDNVRIKEHGWIQVSSHLSNPGLGLRIGNNTYVGPHCVIGAAGGVQIGDDVTIGAYVHLLAEDHRFDTADKPVGDQGVRRQGISIGRGAWLGNASIVLDGVTVGENAVVGAGAVVTKDVAPRTVVAGNPAHVIKEPAPPPQ